MTPAEEQQLEHAAKTNAAVRKLLEERAKLRATIVTISDVATKSLGRLALRDIERCTAIIELADIAEEFATIGVDVAKKRRVAAIRKTAEP